MDALLRRILTALGVNETRQRNYSRPVSDDLIKKIERNRPKTKDQLNRIWYGYHNRRPQHFDSSRYHGVNLHNVWYRGTVDGDTLHTGKVKAYDQLVLAVAAKALNGRAASSRKRSFDPRSARYDFRVFLLHLGLIGDEFKIYNADYLFRRFELRRFAQVDSELLFRLAHNAVRDDRIDMFRHEAPMILWPTPNPRPAYLFKASVSQQVIGIRSTVNWSHSPTRSATYLLSIGWKAFGLSNIACTSG